MAPAVRECPAERHTFAPITANDGSFLLLFRFRFDADVESVRGRERDDFFAAIVRRFGQADDRRRSVSTRSISHRREIIIFRSSVSGGACERDRFADVHLDAI